MQLLLPLPLLQVLKQLADAVKELDGTIEEAAEALQEQQEQQPEEAVGEAVAHVSGGSPAAAAALAGIARPASGGAEGAGASGAEGGDDDDEGGFGFDQEEFDARQLAVARGTHALLAEAVGLLKLVVKQLLAER